MMGDTLSQPLLRTTSRTALSRSTPSRLKRPRLSVVVLPPWSPLLPVALTVAPLPTGSPESSIVPLTVTPPPPPPQALSANATNPSEIANLRITLPHSSVSGLNVEDKAMTPAPEGTKVLN
jgi:hypothetical protein